VQQGCSKRRRARQRAGVLWALRDRGGSEAQTVDLGRDARIVVAKDPLHGHRVGARHHQKARGRVTQIVKADRADDRRRPELVLVTWAAAKCVVVGALAVGAVLVAAHVLVADYDSGAREGAPKGALEANVLAHAGAVRLPVQATGLTGGVVSFSVGAEDACVVGDGGVVECWGESEYDDLLDGQSVGPSGDELVPTLQPGF